MPISIGAPAEHGFDEPLALLSDCHRRIERFLTVLQKVADRAKDRLLDDEERRAVETALHYFRDAAPRHTADEEESLFPLLRASERAGVQAALKSVEALEADHAVANLAHAEIESLYRRWLDTGPLAPAELSRLARIMDDLRERYRKHIEIEDRQIFPLADKALTQEQLARVGQEMARRRGVVR